MCEQCSDRRKISLGFTEEMVPEGQHVCYIYNDDAERLKTMSKYMASGILANEKLLYLVDAMTPEEMLDCLEELGVDARADAARLQVAEAAPAYCPSGFFDADDMLDIVRAFYRRAVDEEGYPGARGTGEMSWCLIDGLADEVSVLEYEARLNHLVAEHPYTAVCQYDARRFNGGLIMDVLSVHPAMIVRGQLVKNPYYIDPDVFLKNYYARFSG